MVATSTQIALCELLLSGCTTAIDHHYLFPDGLEHAIDIQTDTEILDDSQRLIKAYHQYEEGAMTRIAKINLDFKICLEYLEVKIL